MSEFCVYEKHGGICEKTGGFCNLGACPYEDLKEYAPVRHGRWIEQDELEGERILLCSVCGYPVSKFWGKTDFCPKCSADMRGDKK